MLVVGLLAVVLATVNMVGGFVVTDRMLEMFTRKRPGPRPPEGAAPDDRTRPGRSSATWSRAVCFILALKGLSSPQHARTGNLLGAAGAVLACVIIFFALKPDHLVPILIAIAVGTVVGVVGAQRVQMTQMPQLVALFNGVGGGAAALVALLELGDVADARTSRRFTLAATAFTVLVGAVSFSGSLVTFAKLQELMTTRPVTFPGLPVAFARAAARRVALSVLAVSDPPVWDRRPALPGRSALGVMLVLPGRRCRRTDRHLAAERVHRPDRRGRRLRARQHRCCWSPARWSARPVRC